jgi:hypothetical protein
MASRGKIKRLRLEPIVKSEITPVVNRKFSRNILKKALKTNKIQKKWRNYRINLKGLIPCLREFKATTRKHLRPKELSEYNIKK